MPFENVKSELEFFDELAQGGAQAVQLTGRFMVNLLSRIDEVETNLKWHVGTSHQTLMFCSVEELAVSVDALTYAQPHLMKEQIDDVTGIYKIEYQMRHENRPWPNAKISIVAKNVPEALAILEVAFLDCQKMYFIAPRRD